MITWTTTLPTASGYYWYCEPDDEPTIVEYDHKMQWIMFTGSEIPSGKDMPAPITGHFWPEPITAPASTTPAHRHLRYNLHVAPAQHPELIMQQLGITYQKATPRSMGDQWWFWNCQNIPAALPAYLEPLTPSPIQATHYGLTTAEAMNIASTA